MANPQKLRGVCIGAGYFSHFQYEAWQRIPEVDLVAFSNRDPDRARAIRDKFKLARCYADYREMFDRERPDFVDVITPPPSHQALCAEAAARGIHIVCQKPLAPSLAQARAIVANADRAGVRFMVHENFRFQPWHREIRRQLTAGALGDRLHSLHFRMRMGDGWGPDAYIPRQPYFRDYPRLLMYETGVHFIDTFRYLAGEITRVSAWLRRLNSVIQGEDCGVVLFEFANGAVGLYDANRFNEPNYPEARYTFGEFLVEGNGGSLRLYPDARLTLQPLGQPEHDLDYPHQNLNFCGDCCYLTQRHFIDRLLDGQPFETNGHDYLQTLAVQEAVYRSAQTRSPVDVETVNRDSPFRGLDHLAIAVPDTEAALAIWRDRFGFALVLQEEVNGGTVRLTHLELGNTHLQLVQPLSPDHPLQAWLAKHGPALHHFCLRVDDLGQAMAAVRERGLPTAPAPHQGTQGKRALFLDKSATQGVQVELTGQ